MMGIELDDVRRPTVYERSMGKRLTNGSSSLSLLPPSC